MEGGALDLETHHIVSLAEGGPDDDQNVVALCADDHRRAHFAEQRATIKSQLASIIQGQQGHLKVSR